MVLENNLGRWDLGALTEGLVTSRRFMRNLKTELKPQVVNGEWRGAGAPVYRENGNAGNKYYGSFNGKSYSDADNVISEQPVYVANQGRTVSTKLPLSCLSTCMRIDKKPHIRGIDGIYPHDFKMRLEESSAE